MKTEELIRYYKANIEAIEKGLNNDSLSADKNSDWDIHNKRWTDISLLYKNFLEIITTNNRREQMSKVTELTKEFQRVMYSTTYSFEIDTEDYVFGFKNTIKKRTKSLAKASKLKVKLTNDCGRFLSETVRVVAVRFYKNGELTKKLKAEEISAKYNG